MSGTGILWRKPTPLKWSQKEIITRNGIKVLSLGVGQQLRGRRNKEFRPSLIILDDIEPGDGCGRAEFLWWKLVVRR